MSECTDSTEKLGNTFSPARTRRYSHQPATSPRTVPEKSAGDDRRRIVLLAFDGVRPLDLIGPMEVFSVAAEMRGSYSMTLCSPDGEDVITSVGARLSVDMPAGQVVDAHTIIVPGSAALPYDMAPGLLDSITAAANEMTQRIASVCTGAFALAAGGYLNDRRATTHWKWAGAFAKQYPRVSVERDAIYVRDGPFLTSAGVTAGIDLALAMVEEDEGSELARDIARDLVVFMQRPGGQSQFSVAASLPRPQSSVLREVLDAVVSDPAADHSLTNLAKRAEVSVRQLTRLFNDQIGSTAAAYVESVRLETARGLLENGHPVARAAQTSGFGSDESMRRAFLRHFGVTPSAYRARFRSTTSM